MAVNRYNLGLFNSGTYSPFNCDISSITQANPALVTTTVNHGFVVGNTVLFYIPQVWGMQQLNNQKALVVSIPAANEFTINIDSTSFNAFTTPSLPPFVVIDPAQVSSVGDVNTGQTFPGGVPPIPNTIPGAYINQPP